MHSPHDRIRRGPGGQLAQYAQASSGFLVVSVLRQPWRPRCSGKRNSPASSIRLSTKHRRYRPRRLREADWALPAGAEACARARPRLRVRKGTNDCDTRRLGLARIAPEVVTSSQWLRHAEQGLAGRVVLQYWKSQRGAGESRSSLVVSPAARSGLCQAKSAKCVPRQGLSRPIQHDGWNESCQAGLPTAGVRCLKTAHGVRSSVRLEFFRSARLGLRVPHGLFGFAPPRLHLLLTEPRRRGCGIDGPASQKVCARLKVLRSVALDSATRALRCPHGSVS